MAVWHASLMQAGKAPVKSWLEISRARLSISSGTMQRSRSRLYAASVRVLARSASLFLNSAPSASDSLVACQVSRMSSVMDWEALASGSGVLQMLFAARCPNEQHLEAIYIVKRLKSTFADDSFWKDPLFSAISPGSEPICVTMITSE